MSWLCRIGWHRWKGPFVRPSGPGIRTLGPLASIRIFKEVDHHCTRCGVRK